MSFDLLITRAPSLDRRRSGRPITTDELRAALGGAARPQPDGHHRVDHREGDPWYTATWQAPGDVRLSISYGYHRFLRNLGDLFTEGLRVAAALDARLFEEPGGRLVTARTIEALLRPDGPYVAEQAKLWRHTLDELAVSGNAPLEFPVDGADAVGPYFWFRLTPARTIVDADVMGLAPAIPGIGIEREQADVWTLCDPPREHALARVCRRPRGSWLIMPAWDRCPFARVAPVTTAAAELLTIAVGGRLEFAGQPYHAALRREVRQRLGGLGVDFVAWQHGAPPHR